MRPGDDATPGPEVFISYAEVDAAAAEEVCARLKRARVATRMARTDGMPGESFVRFIEHGLSTARYCLLLWSRAAARSRWVALEWEAALRRAVEDVHGFLLVGRLDREPLPVLLGPRLHVDLFPNPAPGLDRLLAAWRADRGAEAYSGLPVAAPPPATEPATARQNGPRDTVYVTSEHFAFTLPFAAALDAPAGLLLDEALSRCPVPRGYDHDGHVGLRFSYELARGSRALVRARSLRSQGVHAGEVMTLLAHCTPYGHAGWQPVTFRDDAPDCAASLDLIALGLGVVGLG